MELPLCNQLRSARENRGLTLQDVAHATRIPVPRLTQMEEGNIAAFGNMSYARGFIQLYSKFLGVDASSFVKELPQPILGGPNDYRHLIDSYGPWVRSNQRRSTSTRRDPVPASARGVYAFVLFLALCICSGVIASNFLYKPSDAKGPSLSTPAAASLSNPVAAVSARNTSTNSQVVPPNPNPPVTASKAPTAQAAPVVAKLAAKGEQKLISLAGQKQAPPAEEVRPPDVSSLPVMRAKPVEDGEIDPDSGQ